MHKTYAALDTAQQESLTHDLLEFVNRHNRSGDESMVLPSSYLGVVIDR